MMAGIEVVADKLASLPKLTETVEPHTRQWAWLALGVLAGVLLIVLPVGLALLYRTWSHRKRVLNSGGAAGLSADTLSKLWHAFLGRLPRIPRALVSRYPAVVVLGPAGSGKSQVIGSFVDWHGQASQFLPSLTDNPYLQIYLGNRLVVQELGAQVLYNGASVIEQALRGAWAPLCKERAPMALVTLKLPMLENTSPEERAELGHQLRGKLGLLGKLVGTPIEVRVCLTHMETVPGFVSFARFCLAHQIPLLLPLNGSTQAKEIITQAEGLTKYLPIALTRLDAGEYRQVVLFLSELPRLGSALDGLLGPLTSWSATSLAPSVERLYLFSSQDGAHGNNPFGGRKVQLVTGLAARVKAFFPAWVQGAQWHVLGVGLLLTLATIILVGSALRHGRAIHDAEESVDVFAQTAERAQKMVGDVRESAAVRVAAHEARQSLEVLSVTERTWSIHRFLYRGAKSIIKDRFLKTVREAYFAPLIRRFSAQRDIDRTLYTLAVLYASRDNALGSLVNGELNDIANAIEVPDAIITDYIMLSDASWQVATEVNWSRLLSGPQPLTGQVQEWVKFFREVQKIYSARSISADRLRLIQEAATPYMQTTDAVRSKRKLAQLLNALAQESPLIEIEKRVAVQHPELQPKEWLRDQQGAISGVLHMIHDTDPASLRPGQLSLVHVLRLLTDLDTRRQTDDHPHQFEIDEQSFSFSQVEWQDMLLRGRNQTVLGTLYLNEDRASLNTQPADDNKPAGQRFQRAAKRKRGPRTSHAGAHAGQSDAAVGGVDSSHKRSAGSAKDTSPNGMLAHEASTYSRESFDRNMRGLLQKLDKGLSDASGLPNAQRQVLVQYVEKEVSRYADKYCAALLVQHRGYVFPGGALNSTRAALLDLVTPNGSLTSHLKRTADNASLTSLEGRFTQNLAACLRQFGPIATVVQADKEGHRPALQTYAEIIQGAVKELDAGKAAEVREDGKAQTLLDLLTPLGRVGLAVLSESEGSPERKVLQYLVAAGIGAPLAQPFLAPVEQLGKLGISEVEQTLAAQWRGPVFSVVQPLFARYPIDRRAARELQASELEVLKPTDGAFWTIFRQTFGPVVLEQGGTWIPRTWPKGSVGLPREMLPLVNQLATLSRVLFEKDGARRALAFEIKPLPIQTCDPKNPATASFLMVGKAQVFGANTKPSSASLGLPWWQQEIASVGIEFSKSSGEQAAQSIEVADSLWSFFRLLDRATEERGMYTWRLPTDDGSAACEVRFELIRNPTASFRVATP